MQNHLSYLKNLISRFLLLVILFQVSRLIFFVTNFNHFSENSVWEILSAFFWGTRFDLWSIFVFNSLFALFHLIPGNLKNKKWYKRLLHYYFTIVNSLILLPDFIDTAYFQYTQKRSTSDIFSMVSTGTDTWNMLPQFLKDYWYLLVLYIVFVFAIHKLYKVFSFPLKPYKKPSIKAIIVQLLLIPVIFALMFAVIRGINERPVDIISAAKFTQSRNVPLVLNSSFSITQTFSREDIQVKNYFKKGDEDKYFTPIYTINSKYSEKKYNVIIIILESFSKEYFGFYNQSFKGKYTPFLDSLLEQGLSFRYSFANGHKSMEALPAILAGIPALMDNPYITSKYAANNITGLPAILKSKGYHTSMFHGGANGTMGFDNFSFLAGVDHYYGKDEYPDKKDDDGSWGIWDEPFFQFMAKELNSFQRPFFSVLYTLSSHHPFKIPLQYEGTLPTGNLEIEQIIAYSDLALRKFFETISKEPWYKNTLFVITADHTAFFEDSYYNNRMGMYAVPILYYTPGDSLLKGINQTRITQHCDIFPSVIDYLGINTTLSCYGKSIFDNQQKGFAVQYISGEYQLIKDSLIILFDGYQHASQYNILNDSLMNNPEDDQRSPQLLMLKSIIQQYDQDVVGNKMTIKK